MRTVIQRVKSASVSVDGEVVSSIGPGLLCYIGLGKDDSEEDAAYIIRKILGIRLWPSQDGKKPWHRNVQDVDGSVLCVSQFTLFGRLSGNKPDYSRAQVPSTARDQYHAVLEALGKAYRPERVRDGVFGAMMDVASVNDGPVTWYLDSKERGAPPGWPKGPDAVRVAAIPGPDSRSIGAKRSRRSGIRLDLGIPRPLQAGVDSILRKRAGLPPRLFSLSRNHSGVMSNANNGVPSFHNNHGPFHIGS
ncbi:hypothetical protein ACKKBG_A26740 [Auxenochlorella protothecoides x Auxenochlorella symbiontica]